ncbi:hypothetical protein F3Y22_tig00110020pilonHSYRG00230 [Hibiscus syriacus]|uniref:Reverse transcriptase zinc-binding domain-containing protein n=1 Tax=Hibiscus syriacus TaxID=106335 RepID=A0A6A3BP79_HIBSY|nr:hypothetical protein F3Y22_tig00110020pilonHSYRG00230 [Hibiscus syriacus]
MPVKEVLKHSGLLAGDIYVELIGGATRVPKLQVCTTFFLMLHGGTNCYSQEYFGRKDLDKHLDADEAIVHGAALHAANLSDGIKLNRFTCARMKKLPSKIFKSLIIAKILKCLAYDHEDLLPPGLSSPVFAQSGILSLDRAEAVFQVTEWVEVPKRNLTVENSTSASPDVFADLADHGTEKKLKKLTFRIPVKLETSEDFKRIFNDERQSVIKKLDEEGRGVFWRLKIWLSMLKTGKSLEKHHAVAHSSESSSWVKRSLKGIIKNLFELELVHNALVNEGYDEMGKGYDILDDTKTGKIFMGKWVWKFGRDDLGVWDLQLRRNLMDSGLSIGGTDGVGIIFAAVEGGDRVGGKVVGMGLVPPKVEISCGKYSSEDGCQNCFIEKRDPTRIFGDLFQEQFSGLFGCAGIRLFENDKMDKDNLFFLSILTGKGVVLVEFLRCWHISRCINEEADGLAKSGIDQITIGSYGRSFKVTMKIGSANDESIFFSTNPPVVNSDEGQLGAFMTENEGDMIWSEMRKILLDQEENCQRVDSWMEQGAAIRLDGECGRRSDPEIIEQDGFRAKDSELSSLSTKSVPLEKRKRRSYKRVYKRCRGRKYWMGSILNFKPKKDSALIVRDWRNINSRGNQLDSLLVDAEFQGCEDVNDGSNSGDMSVERVVEGLQLMGDNHSFESSFFIRRARRHLLREALERVSISTASSSGFSDLLDGALVTWEIRNEIGENSKVFLRSGLNNLKGVIESPSVGSSGGLLMFWDDNVFELQNQCTSRRFIAISGRFRANNFSCRFINVYGPSVEEEKESFFEELSTFIGGYSEPICVGGDLNVYLQEDEKIDSPTYVRLDRFLVDSQFLAAFPDLTQSLLPRSLSDHNAVIIENGGVNWGKKPFKLFNYMMDEAGLDDVIRKRGKFPGALISEIELKIQKLEVEVQQQQDGTYDEKAAELKELRWRGWIRKCVTTASVSVLVNGVPTEEFAMAKGRGVDALKLSHLQFVDDLIMFCGASKTQILNVKRVLSVFQVISGLQLNLKKRLPLGATRNSTALWNPLVNNFMNKLAGWKVVSLSLAGRFWQNNWALDFPLLIIFPRLFSISTNKMVEEWVNLMNAISSVSLSKELCDGVIWKGTGDGIPPRVESFMWQVVLGKLAVRSELVKRRIQGIVDIRFPLCKREVESPSHLFFTCSVVWMIWNKFLNFWKIKSVLHVNAKKFLLAWAELKSSSTIWSFIPGAVIWTTWKVRNLIVFEGGKLDLAEYFFVARFRLASWFLAKYKEVSIPKDSLISDPSLGDLCSLYVTPPTRIRPGYESEVSH